MPVGCHSAGLGLELWHRQHDDQRSPPRLREVWDGRGWPTAARSSHGPSLFRDLRSRLLSQALTPGWADLLLWALGNLTDPGGASWIPGLGLGCCILQKHGPPRPAQPLPLTNPCLCSGSGESPWTLPDAGAWWRMQTSERCRRRFEKPPSGQSGPCQVE